MRRLRGAIFDLDGTLVDSGLDFTAIRREIGHVDGPLLEAMEEMPDPERRRAEAILHRHEVAGARRATLFPGVAAFVDWLRRRHVRLGILTRNSREITAMTLVRCRLPIETIVAREDAPPKPDPQGVLAICSEWGLEPADVMVIGDYVFDIHAGRNAGCPTALVLHGRDLDYVDEADYCIEHFGQAVERLGPAFDHADGKCKR